MRWGGPRRGPGGTEGRARGEGAAGASLCACAYCATLTGVTGNIVVREFRRGDTISYEKVSLELSEATIFPRQC